MDASRVPWRMKIAAKLVLARLPVSYDRWRRIGFFRHGAMDDPGYALDVFRTHAERAGADLEPGFTALEIGPGDSLLNAVCARALGAGSVFLVDVDRFAVTDLSPYRLLAQRLRDDGYDVPDLDGVETIDELLDRCGATYLTDGIESLRSLPADSIDLSWSQAVLEHVRRAEFDDLCAELHRLHRPGTRSSHRIDLQDHLDHSLNNLRFSPARWESKLVQTSGFYTNRLGYTEICEAFAASGFEVDVVGIDRWPEIPVPRRNLDPSFRDRPDDELRIIDFDVVLTA